MALLGEHVRVIQVEILRCRWAYHLRGWLITLLFDVFWIFLGMVYYWVYHMTGPMEMIEEYI